MYSSHLLFTGQETDTTNKVKKIREIWDAKRRVVILQVFEGKTSEEALTREACMIEAIGKYCQRNVSPPVLAHVVASYPCRLPKLLSLAVFLHVCYIL